MAKLQIPKKLQVPSSNPKLSSAVWCLGFGTSLELGTWDLDFLQLAA